MDATLAKMRRIIDVNKIEFVQVVDAERLAEPLIEGHVFYDKEQSPRMSWSRNCRLFYGETDRGAYLPIHDVLRTILVDLGFEGYMSAELFNRSLTDPDNSMPKEHGRRAAESWKKIVKDFNLGIPASSIFFDGIARWDRSDQQQESALPRL